MLPKSRTATHLNISLDPTGLHPAAALCPPSTLPVAGFNLEFVSVFHKHTAQVGALYTTLQDATCELEAEEVEYEE